MVATYKPWHSISVPVKVELKSPAKMSLSGRAYMVNDSVIHVSMRLLGFEVAVLHVTSDSIYCVDKVRKMAIVEGLDRLSAGSGVTLGQLQSLMLGRAVVPGDNSMISRKSKSVKLSEATDGTDNWMVTARAKGRFAYTCVFDVDAKDNQVGTVEVVVPGHKTVSCSYNDWTACEIGWMPGSVSCDVTIASKRLDATLRYTPSSLRVDRDDLPSFSRPGKGYRYIGAADLLKTLSSSLNL